MRKILIVDADKQVTSLLRYKLSSENFDVKCLDSTINAIHVVKEFMPDLIVSEMDLPEQSGVDFLKRVKVNPELSEIPFIFLSSSRKVEDKILAHEMGAEDYFTKPILIKVVLNRIQDFFREQEFNSIVTSGESTRTFEGRLMSISLLDLLNIVNENKKTGCIHITADSGTAEGDIFFRNSTLYHVSARDVSGERTGKKGLFLLLPVMSGTFRLAYEETSDSSTMEDSLDTVLLDATEWLDRYTAGLGDLPPADTRLFVDFSAFFSNLPKMPDDIGTVLAPVGEEGKTVSAMLEQPNIDREKSVGYISRLIKLGVLTTDREKAKRTPDIPLPEWATGGDESADDEEQTVAPPPEMPGTGEDDAFLEDIQTVADSSEPAEESDETGDGESTPVPAEEPGGEADVVQQEEQPEEETVVEQPEQAEQAEQVEEQISDTAADDDAPPISTEDLASVLQSAEEDSIIDEEHIDEDIADVDGVISDTVRHSRTNLFIAGILIAVGVLVAAALMYLYTGEDIADDAVAAWQQPETPDAEAGAAEKSPYAEYSFDKLNEMANTEFGKGNYTESVKLYELALKKLVTKDDDNETAEATIRKNMAIAYYSGNMYRKALAEIERALLLVPDPEKIELKAAVLEELDRRNNAALLLEKALESPSLTITGDARERFKKEIQRLRSEGKSGGETAQ